MWNGWRFLLFAYVDDNSSLKSRFIHRFESGGKVYDAIGKGVRKNDEQVVRLCVVGWTFYPFGADVPMAIGFGKWLMGKQV